MVTHFFLNILLHKILVLVQSLIITVFAIIKFICEHRFVPQKKNNSRSARHQSTHMIYVYSHYPFWIPGILNILISAYIFNNLNVK